MVKGRREIKVPIYNDPQLLVEFAKNELEMASWIQSGGHNAAAREWGVKGLQNLATARRMAVSAGLIFPERD